jgi:nucleoside-diphosphate-sugar epimerase
VERVVAGTPRIHPALRCTVVRPAALVGPGVDTMITRHFETPRLLALRGQTMLWQFLHVDDLGTAVATAIEHDLDGELTAGAMPWLTAEQVERLTGMRRVELPAGLAFGTAQRLQRTRVLPTPAEYLAYVVHPWVVGAARLADAGWAPRHDAEDCLAVLMAEVRGRFGVAGLRVERREAAWGAAGAAVAVVGAAALLRQARSRRKPGSRHTL